MDSVTDVKTLQDAHYWDVSVDGAVEDEIACKSVRAQFYNKVCGLNLVKGIKRGMELIAKMSSVEDLSKFCLIFQNDK